MLKLQVYLHEIQAKSMNKKALDNSQSINHWMILPQCPIVKRQVL